MAGNAVEPFHPNQVAAVFVATYLVFFSVPRRGLHIGAGIGSG